MSSTKGAAILRLIASLQGYSEKLFPTVHFVYYIDCFSAGAQRSGSWVVPGYPQGHRIEGLWAFDN